MFCSVEKTNVISDIKLRNRTEKRIFNTLLVLRDSRPVENISSTSEIYLMGCHQDGQVTIIYLHIPYLILKLDVLTFYYLSYFPYEGQNGSLRKVHTRATEFKP